MKAIILNLFIAVGLFLGGCSDQSSLTGPSQQDPQSSNTLISLGTNGLQKPISISETINGNTGGSIAIVGTFGNGPAKIEINGTLTVPAGAYSGNQTITVFMDGQYAALNFGPSPFTFDIPLNFTMEIKGVRLKGGPKAYEKVKFVYIAADGSVAPVEMQGTTVADKKGKMLSVYDAQLPHFSRYGWSK